MRTDRYVSQKHGASGSRRSRWARASCAALSGLIAGFTALCVAELVAAAVRPEAGPVTAVGGAVIDRTPAAVKDFAVRNFGTDDKLVLQLGILVLLALFAMAVGVLALRHRWSGAAAVLVFGVVGAVAAAGRPEGRPADALPSVVGALVAAGVLYLLAARLAPAPVPPPAAGETDGGVQGAFDRRGFVVAATTAAAASAGAGLLGRRLQASRLAGVSASREGVTLPAPASPAPAIPDGVDLGIRGLSSFVTPNKDFYRVDTALVVPRVDAGRWRLRIHGEGVPRPVTLGFQDLLRRELVERDITLTCVSNQVGGPYVGTARWIGVRLADLLSEAGVKPPSKGGPADQIVARSVDGMTIGTPVEEVMDGRDALLAVGMNGEPLPFDHGFPVRMVVPGLYGYVSACKWIRDIELTTFDAYDAYWVKRDWSREAPVKTQSRIDTPRPFASPRAGTVPVAGVAWAQHRGIARVEVRVDGGAWHTARLAAEAGRDTWRQWVWEWPATTGHHTLEVRATDRTGATQTDERVGTVPDGATGWHSVVVDVT
ncbi:oxidoreductase [Streptomyces clavifer]|uniref:DMSO/TMAO reductase YedYZ molybdopterin-dependent catalytic subunit n=1 Tax=Streptomyces clavifer TaxID=68188 RepID=A0ABS4VEK8_9ACTN|nr:MULTISPECIES: molybdopterin-dependent oxidoreductase [Streptomyces]MBP2362358.1 DMSO/TMAO reductase YedYZ molybdopterin-dependent catalytic subunit [Streptomyces clavifer]MDX2745439.1 molybdopterin-dependent oxidoreductase [Streptomyces sp. NRRL_B-2557]GHB06556.1 oxidoreductase [Streptomyces clavifer]